MDVFINILVTVISVPLMMKYVPSFKPFNKDKSLDAIGIAMLGIISTSLIYGITEEEIKVHFGSFSSLFV